MRITGSRCICIPYATIPRPMHRMRSRSLVVATLAMVALGLVATSPAIADRSATKTERAAIKRVTTKRCSAPDGCTFRKARISTRNARYAWAEVIGEGVSGMLLKRPTSHSRRFKVVGFQGGGIGECTYWRKRAPRSVLRDLDVDGLVDIASGTEGNCG
jgi:hypothetical protein